MNIEINQSINYYYSFDEMRSIFQRFSKLSGFTLQEIGASENGKPIELISYKSTVNKKNSILLFGGEDASEAIFSQTFSHLPAFC